MKGEVRCTVNRVHGAWGGGSLRNGSATPFPRDSGEASGSPALTMDEMQRGAQRVSRSSLAEEKREKSLGSAVASAF
jgi:hypothetical protein